MSYSQEIYDAVRSRISGGDIGSVVADVARQALDISFLQGIAQQEIYAVGHEWQRPSVLFRPTIYPDGTMWCALLGDDLQQGIAGFGDTPDAAMRAFDVAFAKERTPTAARLASAENSPA